MLILGGNQRGIRLAMNQLFLCTIFILLGSSTFFILAIIIVFSIIGVFGVFIVGALMVYGCYRWKLSHQSKPPSSPPPPAPLYEDIEISTVKCEVNENVAYGITSQI